MFYSVNENAPTLCLPDYKFANQINPSQTPPLKNRLANCSQALVSSDQGPTNVQLYSTKKSVSDYLHFQAEF